MLTDTAKLRVGDPLPARSPIWDGQRVRLRGVRGETLGLQAIDKEATPVLTLPPAVARVRAFAVRTLTVTEPSTDMYGPSRGAGQYPDPLEPGAPAPHQFFDVAIRSDALAGTYAGTLALAGRTLAVELTVDAARIDLDADPLVWVWFSTKELARAHGLKDDDSPAALAVEKQYVELFRAHGCWLASDVPATRFAARRDFARGLRFWPVALELDSDEATARSARAWLDALADTTLKPFTILVDEPHSAEEKARVRTLGQRVGKAGILRVVTSAPDPAWGDAVDVHMYEGGRWTYNGRPPRAGSLIVDTDGAALRTWGWVAFRDQLELWHIWEGMYYSDRYNRGGPTDVLHDPDTFDERRKGGTDHGNGDGVLAYPHAWPSLRLKALRRGLQDRKLLMQLASCGGTANPPGPPWPADDDTWEAARLRLLDAIARQCPAAPHD